MQQQSQVNPSPITGIYCGRGGPARSRRQYTLSKKLIKLSSWNSSNFRSISQKNHLICGHPEDGSLGSVKNFKTPFFKRFCKFLPWGYSFRSRTSPIFFLFEISQQIQLLEASKVLAKMGRGWQAGWVLAKIFSSNLHRHVMNKCWKFQEDSLTLVWFIAERLKICCNQWTLNAH